MTVLIVLAVAYVLGHLGGQVAADSQPGDIVFSACYAFGVGALLVGVCHLAGLL